VDALRIRLPARDAGRHQRTRRSVVSAWAGMDAARMPRIRKSILRIMPRGSLVASFGRPSTRTWLPLKVAAPRGPIETLDLVEESVPVGTDIADLIAGEQDADVVGLDPTSWRLLRVRFDAVGLPAGRFRVLHLSQPVQR
jgi:hypothetical protein